MSRMSDEEFDRLFDSEAFATLWREGKRARASEAEQSATIAALTAEREALRSTMLELRGYLDTFPAWQRMIDAALTPPTSVEGIRKLSANSETPRCRGCGKSPCIDTAPGEQDPDYESQGQFLMRQMAEETPDGDDPDRR